MARLSFDGISLDGDVEISLLPDGLHPSHGQMTEAVVNLKAALRAGEPVGRDTGVFGTEKRRQGDVSVQPATRSRLRDLSAPLLRPSMPWRVWLATGPKIERASDRSLSVSPHGPGRPSEPLGATNASVSARPPRGWAGAACHGGGDMESGALKANRSPTGSAPTSGTEGRRRSRRVPRR